MRFFRTPESEEEEMWETRLDDMTYKLREEIRVLKERIRELEIENRELRERK